MCRRVVVTSVDPIVGLSARGDDAALSWLRVGSPEPSAGGRVFQLEVSADAAQGSEAEGRVQLSVLGGEERVELPVRLALGATP